MVVIKESVVSRAGSKLGLRVWFLCPQRSLRFILMLPWHLEGRGEGAGEREAPGGAEEDGQAQKERGGLSCER